MNNAEKSKAVIMTASNFNTVHKSSDSLFIGYLISSASSYVMNSVF